MATYYVSASGSNSNSGTSPSSPWRTLSKVNSSIKSGDTVQFKCGDTFYGKIKAIADSTNTTTIGSYGSGAKPIITFYKSVNADAWVKQSDNVWKVDLTNPDNFTGNAGDKSTNVGFIKINGTIYPALKISTDELATQWDFYSDLQFLYLYSSDKPSSVFQNADIQIACKTNLIDLSNNLEIHDIKVQGAGGHGINGNAVSNNKITNVDIAEIGGSLLHGFNAGRTRYGNGIQFWQGGNNIEVSGCHVSDVYDVAFTMQGANKSKDWVDIRFQHNVAKNNNQTLELWARGNVAGFYNCRFENNDCYDAGYGWSANVRPDKNVGVHILFYWWEVTKADVTITKNLFYRAKNGLYYANKKSDIPDITSGENEIFLDAGESIRSGDKSFSVDDFKGFVQQSNKEKKSNVYILGEDKKVVKKLLSL